jgi:hypothetical protein
MGCRFNLSQVGELIAIQCTVASTIISVLMRVRDMPAAYGAETQPALGSHQYHNAYAPAPIHVVPVGRPHFPSYPSRRSEEEGNTHPSCDGLHKAYKSDPEFVDYGDHWVSPVTLAWDVGASGRGVA